MKKSKILVKFKKRIYGQLLTDSIKIIQILCNYSWEETTNCDHKNYEKLLSFIKNFIRKIVK